MGRVAQCGGTSEMLNIQILVLEAGEPGTIGVLPPNNCILK